jgi:quercetin dioxygenase-like cupin family protein
MSSTASQSEVTGDEFWWQGSLMQIKARAADTDGAVGLVEGTFYEGFGPPLHVHRREQEGMLVLEGEIRFRQGEDDFVGGPGTLAWVRPGVPHAFKVTSPSARALVIVTPAGFEQMFADGGVARSDSTDPPVQHYDPDAARALAERYGFEVVGPQLD